MKTTVSTDNGVPEETEIVTYALRASGGIDYSAQYIAVTPPQGAVGLDNVTSYRWRISPEPASTAYDYHQTNRPDSVENSDGVTHESATFGFEHMMLFDQMVSELNPSSMEVRMQEFHEKYPSRFRFNKSGRPGEWEYEDLTRANTWENGYGRSQEVGQKLRELPPGTPIPPELNIQPPTTAFRLLPYAVYAGQGPVTSHLYGLQTEPDSGPLNGNRFYGNQRPLRVSRWQLQQNHRFDQYDFFDVLRALHFQFLP